MLKADVEIAIWPIDDPGSAEPARPPGSRNTGWESRCRGRRPASTQLVAPAATTLAQVPTVVGVPPPEQGNRLGCPLSAAAWAVGVMLLGAAAAREDPEWGVPLALWVVGQPLVLASWLVPRGLRGRRCMLARAGCMALSIAFTLCVGFLVAWAMLTSDMLGGVPE